MGKRWRVFALINDKDVLVESPFENRFNAFKGEGLYHKRSFAGGFETFRAVACAEPHDTQAGTEALLRVWSALQNPDDKFFGVRPVFPSPVNDSRRGPIEISLMALWHVLP